jgi:hypothetical protein
VDEAQNLDLVSASLRADAADMRVFVESLAAKLEQTFPGRCRVRRAGLLGKGSVRQVSVEPGDGRYELTQARSAGPVFGMTPETSWVASLDLREHRSGRIRAAASAA